MMRKKTMLALALCAAGALAAGAALSGRTASATAPGSAVGAGAGANRGELPLPMITMRQGVMPVTSPSADLTLSFLQVGAIGKVLVKEGDKVAVDQLLVEQDSSVEQFVLEQLRAEKDDDIRVQAAQAQLELKQKDFAKADDLYRGPSKAVTEKEWDDARLDMVIGEKTLAVQKFDHAQKSTEYDKTKAQIDRMRKASPIAGVVEKLFVHPGESVNVAQPVIRVVQLDPLYVDVYVPLKQAKLLRPGQGARVDFLDEAGEKADGKVLHVSSVAVAERLIVRLEVPNPAGRPAGEQVNVSFSESVLPARAP